MALVVYSDLVRSTELDRVIRLPSRPTRYRTVERNLRSLTLVQPTSWALFFHSPTAFTLHRPPRPGSADPDSWGSSVGTLQFSDLGIHGLTGSLELIFWCSVVDRYEELQSGIVFPRRITLATRSVPSMCAKRGSLPQGDQYVPHSTVRKRWHRPEVVGIRPGEFTFWFYN